MADVSSTAAELLEPSYTKAYGELAASQGGTKAVYRIAHKFSASDLYPKKPFSGALKQNVINLAGIISVSRFSSFLSVAQPAADIFGSIFCAFDGRCIPLYCLMYPVLLAPARRVEVVL